MTGRGAGVEKIGGEDSGETRGRCFIGRVANGEVKEKASACVGEKKCGASWLVGSRNKPE
jgi:hypothetical protein